MGLSHSLLDGFRADGRQMGYTKSDDYLCCLCHADDASNRNIHTLGVAPFVRIDDRLIILALGVVNCFICYLFDLFRKYVWMFSIIKLYICS